MNAKGPATEEGGPRGLENDASTDVIVGALKALAHPIRYRIVQLLADKGSFGVEDENCCSRDEACVCKISELFDVSAPTLSHHLKVLREAGLVEGRRDGTVHNPHPSHAAFFAIAEPRPTNRASAAERDPER